ncbi:hypothetical protein MASR2M17_13150 [Aminivibrio sp.]
MKLSTRGLRAMLYMAERHDGERASVGEIARGAGVPEKYLEQLFTRLRRFGLINSIRGAQEDISSEGLRGDNGSLSC